MKYILCFLGCLIVIFCIVLILSIDNMPPSFKPPIFVPKDSALLLNQGHSSCLIRMNYIEGRSDAVEYFWVFQDDGSYDFTKKNVRKGRGVVKRVYIEGTELIDIYNTALLCGDFRILWNGNKQIYFQTPLAECCYKVAVVKNEEDNMIFESDSIDWFLPSVPSNNSLQDESETPTLNPTELSETQQTENSASPDENPAGNTVNSSKKASDK